jgi:hypothetical protein
VRLGPLSFIEASLGAAALGGHSPAGCRHPALTRPGYGPRPHSASPSSNVRYAARSSLRRAREPAHGPRATDNIRRIGRALARHFPWDCMLTIEAGPVNGGLHIAVKPELKPPDWPRMLPKPGRSGNLGAGQVMPNQTFLYWNSVSLRRTSSPSASFFVISR